MVKEIQQVTEARFGLADSAPIMHTSLRGSVGYLANTNFALNLMKGLVPIPDDVDQPTRELIADYGLRGDNSPCRQ